MFRFTTTTSAVRARRGMLAATIAVGSLALASTSAQSSPATASCDRTGSVAASSLTTGVDAQRCHLVGRYVVADGVRVRVPPQGLAVAGHGAGAGDETAELVVVHDESGTVTASFDHSAAATAPAGSGSTAGSDGTGDTLGARLSACTDTAYKLGSSRQHWAGTLRWSYQAGSTPSWLGRLAVIDQLRAAAGTVGRGRDDCGLAGDPAATVSYLGTTTTRPAVRQYDSSTVSCTARDGRNVVGWGGLPSGVLGYTCYWWTTGSDQMVEADILLAARRSVRTSLPPSCYAKYDLQALATHEWGHAFGLGHPDGSHDLLTMSPYLLDCSRAQRTLGKGDFKGLVDLYGL